MLTFLLGVLVGAFVGWHVPQPEWAKKVSDKLKE